jgi:membrane associated rhomboid family serine protease
MLIPYEVDVPFERTPCVNWLLVASVVAMFGFQTALTIQQPSTTHHDLGPFEPLVLREFKLEQMVGHMWLHLNIFHVIGNLIFLWVFGNAVCQKIGNLIYFPIYLLVGFAAAAAGLMFTPHPERGMIGASGAINGIVGMYLILYPCNDISIFYLFFWGRVNGTFEISGFWMILMWLAFDIFGAIMGVGNVGYFAHLGGFFTGATLAVILLLTRRVVMDEEYEESLLDLIRNTIRPKPEPPSIKTLMDVELAKESLQLDEQSANKAKLPVSGPVPQRGRRETRPTLSGTDIAPIQANDPYPPLQLAETDPKPEAPKFIRYVCGCGKRFKSHPALAGRVGECPQCQKQIVIPDGPIR